MTKIFLRAMLFVATVALFCHSLAAGDDPVAAGIVSGKASLQNAVDDLQAELLDAIDSALERTRKSGDIEAVNEVKAQRDACEATGKLPPIMSSRTYQRHFTKARRQLEECKKLKTDLVKTYQKAIRQYTIQGDDHKANDLVKELRRLELDLFSLYDRMSNLPPPISENSGWIVLGNELFSNPQKPDQAGAVHFGDPTWTEYNFTYEVRLDNKDGVVNARFHANGMKTFRAMEIGGWGNSAKDLYNVLNGNWQNRNGGAFIRPGIDYNKWYKFEIQVRGASVVVLLDNEKIIEGKNEEYRFGGIGFSYHSGASAHIRGVEVTTPDGLVLWRGVIGLGVR